MGRGVLTSSFAPYFLSLMMKKSSLSRRQMSNAPVNGLPQARLKTLKGLQMCLPNKQEAQKVITECCLHRFQNMIQELSKNAEDFNYEL